MKDMDWQGWIILWRKLQNSWLWEDKPFSKGQAWIDLLFLANHEDHKIAYKGQVILCKRGEVDRSVLWLARRWGWGRHKTRDFLDLLEADGMVTVKATTNRTTITIENYNNYQDLRTTNRTANRPSSGQRADNERTHTKNDKELNNISNQSIYISKLLGKNDLDRLTDCFADVDKLLDLVDQKIKQRQQQTPIRNPFSYVTTIAREEGWPTREEAERKSAAREARLREIEEEVERDKEQMNELARSIFQKG